MNVLVLLFLGYLLYRFIGGFLIPLFRASRQVRQQFQDMKQNASGQPNHNGQTGHSGPSAASKPESAPSKVGEYIDFEEIKE